MIKILTVIGARPQIIKAAAISRAIKNHFSSDITEEILHTGQHYDQRMSEVFFEELGIPTPDHQLNVGSGSHGVQTADMIKGIEEILINGKHDALLVYGDTNSTLAGALAAVKIHIPVFHVEAGLRSFNKAMPEEINRITCDHCSSMLFSPTTTGLENLKNEGFKVDAEAPYSPDNPGVFHCGDVMYDNSLHFAELADVRVKNIDLPESFALVTIHRPYNTDDPERLVALIERLVAFSEAKSIDLYVPMHPRTKNILAQHAADKLEQWSGSSRVHITEPVSFLEMIYLEKNAQMIITDSGGVQKEAYFFKKPSVVIRTETEWVELVEHGSARLGFQLDSALGEGLEHAYNYKETEFPPIFGDGKASEFICRKMVEYFQ